MIIYLDLLCQLIGYSSYIFLNYNDDKIYHELYQEMKLVKDI